MVLFTTLKQTNLFPKQRTTKKVFQLHFNAEIQNK